MSIFSWFSRKKHVVESEPRFSMGADATETTQPMPFDAGVSESTTSSSAHRAAARRAENALLREQLKVDSLARRERLYAAVRESCLRVGILVASYKFKVLALDQSGRQYLVMIDLAAALGRTPAQLVELEELIAENAKTQYDIVVTGVYWRLSEQLGTVPMRTTAATAAPPVEEVQPEVAAAPVSVPTPVPPVASDSPSPPSDSHGSRYEPLQTEEMLAFKRALAATGAAPQPAGPRPSTRAYSPLSTGYEDTQVASPHTRPPGLGSTQYGELD